MDEKLQRLVRELRRETCPPRVLDEVARRIAAETRPPARFRYALAGAAGLVLLACLAIWRWPAGGADGHFAGRPQEARRVADQAEGALACIGEVLREASAHSERILLKGAVPPLRNSLETAKNKILEHI